MILKRFLSYSAAIAIAFLPGVVRADILLDSQAGLATCMFNADASTCNTTNGVGTSGSTIAFGITPGSVTGEDTAWQQVPVTNPSDPSDKSAVWIGSVDSGYCASACGKFVPSNTTSANSISGATSGGAPVYQITSQAFTAGWDATLDLNVWADDSVDVFLVNETASTSNEISPPGTSAQNPPCSGEIVSCTTPTEGQFTAGLIAGDTYELQFDVWQTGPGTDNSSNPTGLLYTGNVSAPEPGSVSILLAMLVGVAGFAGILKKKLA